MWIEFVKLEAAGNRYIAIDGRGHDLDWSHVAEYLCDEECAVGSDGLVVACDSNTAPIAMRVINSDGSEAEISGNGLRLFAKFCIERELVLLKDDHLEVETKAGVRPVWPTIEGGKMTSGKIDMGVPSLILGDLPCLSDAPDARRVPIKIDGETIVATCLSVGNPHAVLITDLPVEDFDLERIGEAVQNHELFPKRTNFEVVNVLDRSQVRARIYERGEGETASSGTGSTACATACRVNGLVDERVTVRCSGGDLLVEWSGEGSASLSGPTTTIGQGRFMEEDGAWRWEWIDGKSGGALQPSRS